MDPARHKVGWDGQDVVLTVTEFMILEALAQRPGVVKIAQPVARRRLSGRCLCRRPHDRQPHQAHPAQVPRRRPRVRCDRDALWRRLPLRRGMRKRDLVLSWSGRWTLRSPHPGGQHPDAGAARAAACSISTPSATGWRQERMRQVEREAMVAADALAAVPADAAPSRAGTDRAGRAEAGCGSIDAAGARVVDSWQLTGPTYRLRDPATQALEQGCGAGARPRLQRARRRAPTCPISPSRPVDRLAAWPEAREGASDRRVVNAMRAAPDLTPVLSAPRRSPATAILLVTDNDRNFTRTVRSQRRSLGAGCWR